MVATFETLLVANQAGDAGVIAAVRRCGDLRLEPRQFGGDVGAVPIRCARRMRRGTAKQLHYQHGLAQQRAPHAGIEVVDGEAQAVADPHVLDRHEPGGLPCSQRAGPNGLDRAVEQHHGQLDRARCVALAPAGRDQLGARDLCEVVVKRQTLRQAVERGLEQGAGLGECAAPAFDHTEQRARGAEIAVVLGDLALQSIDHFDDRFPGAGLVVLCVQDARVVLQAGHIQLFVAIRLGLEHGEHLGLHRRRVLQVLQLDQDLTEALLEAENVVRIQCLCAFANLQGFAQQLVRAAVVAEVGARRREVLESSQHTIVVAGPRAPRDRQGLLKCVVGALPLAQPVMGLAEPPQVAHEHVRVERCSSIGRNDAFGQRQALAPLPLVSERRRKLSTHALQHGVVVRQDRVEVGMSRP